MSVAHDPDDRQQAQVAIHVAKLDRAADRVLVRPPAARQRFADHGDVRRIRAVAPVEDPPSDERDPENLEVSVRGGEETCFAEAFFLPGHRQKSVDGRGLLAPREQEKHSVGKAAIHHRQAAGRPDRAHARDLFEPVNEVRIEDRLTRLCPGIVHPRKRDVHRASCPRGIRDSLRGLSTGCVRAIPLRPRGPA